MLAVNRAPVGALVMRKCSECVYVLCYERRNGYGEWVTMFECRKSPPTLVNGDSRWPLVSHSDWCGEFKEKA